MTLTDADLVALERFMAARLDEAEEFALLACSGPRIAYHDPAAVLRSIEADRRLLAALEACRGDRGWDDALMFAVRCRATAWDTHPDYQDKWKP